MLNDEGYAASIVDPSASTNLSQILTPRDRIQFTSLEPLLDDLGTLDFGDYAIAGNGPNDETVLIEA